MFTITYTIEAQKGIKKLAGNKPAMEKLEKLLEEIKVHPRTGTGKIEKLKHFEKETWSRRIDKKNRIIYSIDDEKIIIVVISITGHYKDK